MIHLKLLKNMLFVIFLLTVFFPNSSFSQSKQETEKKYIKLHVDGLACPFCAYGLEKKLTSLDSAENFYIDINGGYAVLDIPASSNVSKDELKGIVSDAGFSLKDMEISDKPFDEGKKGEN